MTRYHRRRNDSILLLTKPGQSRKAKAWTFSLLGRIARFSLRRGGTPVRLRVHLGNVFPDRVLPE